MVVVAAWPAHAAIAVVQTASCEAQGSATCNAGPVTTTNGNLFVASTSFCCDTFTSIADNKGNSYSSSLTETPDGNGGSVRQDYKATGTGGASHTFTVTGGSAAFFATLSVVEVSGASSSPLDQTAIQAEVITENHTSGNTGTTAQANELLIGVGGTISTSTYVTDSGAGWTEGTNVSTDADSEGIITGYKVVSSVSTYAFTWTNPPGLGRAAVTGISTWKESAASATRQRCIGCDIDKKVIGQ